MTSGEYRDRASGGGEMTPFQNYFWIKDFWDGVLSQRPGSRWQVLTCYDGDTFLRDGLAHALTRERLAGRTDVEYRFAKAWDGDDETRGVEPGIDCLFLGRPKPFYASRYHALARRLERGSRGAFVDPNNGQAGGTIQYSHDGSKHLFSRRELEGSTGAFRRCYVDYGLLLYRHETEPEDRRLVSIGGLSSLGTLGMAVILASDLHREKLWQQVRQFASWRPRHRAERAAELVVRIEVASEEALSRLMNGLDGPNGTLPFNFQAELVALATDNGEPAVYVKNPTDLELQIQPAERGRKGGYVRVVGTGAKVKLSRCRFQLIKLLLEAPNDGTRERLAEGLGYYDPSSEKLQDKHKRRLSKLVTDANKSLEEAGLRGRKGKRPIYLKRKLGRYVLEVGSAQGSKRDL
jgi:hypothetical protein